ncbi:MAG: ROK family protein [Coriobacteriia bacterium]|nr:ROK family protein [Coriobacteriia bacterium]
MKVALGVDIGGTAVKAGVFSVEGALLAKTSFSSREPADEPANLRIARGVDAFLANTGVSDEDVLGVGIDVPGPVDSAGHAGVLPNLELDVEALQREAKITFPQANLVVVNDANAAALGELWQGAARDVDSFALVAIGTGVGGGLVADGRLVAGAFGAGGEFGHLVVNREETELCGCGRAGHLEQYASATGIVRAYLRECEKLGVAPVSLDGPTDTLSVFAACREGDKAAERAIAAMADYLGYALAQVSVVADPSLYLIGGGVSAGWDLFGDALQRAFQTYCFKSCTPARIAPAALGNDAALYGSAYLALA